jgi:hypothetical protein
LVLDIHQWWAWVVVIANGLVGLVLIAAQFVEPVRRPWLWWLVAAAELAIFVQVVLGVWLVAAEDRTVEQLHQFYGFVAIITVAILYSYRTQLRDRLYLVYGLASLFLMGLAIRAMVIGPPG